MPSDFQFSSQTAVAEGYIGGKGNPSPSASWSVI